MEEKKHPIMDQDGGEHQTTEGCECLMAAEPAVAFATRDFQRSKRLKSFDYPEDYDPGIGPYSMKEMNARIDKVEHDKDKPDKWIRVNDFWAAMHKEHIWLQ